MTAHIRMLFRGLTLLGCSLCVGAAPSMAGDGHSVESLAQALQRPMPAQVAKQAQDEDARTMSSGRDTRGRQFRQAIDDSPRIVSMIARQLLTAMGEDDRKWTIRVLDTSPATLDVAVSGGRFIYVYTGLVKQATSKDDIAFVVAHELGHSMLKHNPGLHTPLEEREADALATVISIKAGFDAYHGANFMVTEAAKIAERRTMQDKLGRFSDLGIQQQAILCAPTRLDSMNQEKRAQAEISCSRMKDLQGQYDKEAGQLKDRLRPGQFLEHHPHVQGRATAVDGLANYLTGRGDIDSAEQYEASFRVLVALAASESPLLPTSVRYSAELLKVAKQYSSSVSRQPGQGSAQLDTLVKQQRYIEIINILNAQNQSITQFLPWLRQ